MRSLLNMGWKLVPTYVAMLELLLFSATGRWARD